MAPVNDNFADAADLGDFSTVPVLVPIEDMATATIEVGEDSLPGTWGNIGTEITRTVWYKIPAQSPTVTADIQLTLTKDDFFTDYYTFFQIWQLADDGTVDMSTLSLIAQNDDDFTLQSIRFSADAARDYYVQLGMRDDSSESAGLNLLAEWNASVPPNDLYEDREDISGATGTIDGTTIGSNFYGEGGEVHDHGEASVWYRWTAPEDLTDGNVVEFSLDSTNVDWDSWLLLFDDEASLFGMNIRAQNDMDLDRFAFSKVKTKVFNGEAISVRVAGNKSSSFTLSWAMYPNNPHDEYDNPIICIDPASDIHDSQGATLSRQEMNDTDLGLEQNLRGSIWYAWLAPDDFTGDVTFTLTAGTGKWTRLHCWKLNNPDVAPTNLTSDFNFLLTEFGETATAVLSPAPGDLLFIEACSYFTADHTFTWDVGGAPIATPVPDPTATGEMPGGSEANGILVLTASASLTTVGSVETTTGIITRPLMRITPVMPEPAMVNGKLVLPEYWGHYPSSIGLTLGAGHIRVVPDADPGDGDDPDWPDGGPPDYWWTIKDLDTPDPGEPVNLSTWPEHFGGPDLKSTGVYRPSLQRRDNFGANGKKHTYTKAVVFDPDDVNHMWVDLGTSMPQPYTVMMAGIILSYPTRTYGHYLMDAGRPTPVKNVNKDWHVDDNLSYRSVMLFQLHSALICSRPVVEDGVYARVEHNYVNRPRVFLGVFDGTDSKVGWFDTKMKKVSTGRTDNNSVRHLVIGRRTDNISDNLASHMTLFETRIWRKALTPKEYRAQYKQMAGVLKFNLYEKDGV